MYKSWLHRRDGRLEGTLGLDPSRPTYVQVWTPADPPGASPAMRIQPSQLDHLTRPGRGLPRLKRYTDALIDRLVANRTLPREVLTDVDSATLARSPRYHETIARALERHLSSSGEFSYTLDLTRKDKTIDPAEDFVLNTKAGHCQRFATALVLMLRTQGIPSQMVVGYRGCEPRGDGWYDVREDHAHAWVEVLIPASDRDLPPVWTIARELGMELEMRRASIVAGSVAPALMKLPQGPRGWTTMRWQTLDPTPSSAGLDDEGADSFLGQARQRWEAILKSLLLAYNKESREHAVEVVGFWLTERNGALYLAVGVVGLLGLRQVRRRQRARRAATRAAGPPYLRRLVAALARAGYPWSAGRTAREFARGAADGLRLVSATARVADVPERIVAAYYAERFGQVRLGEDERQHLDARLRDLEAAL